MLVYRWVIHDFEYKQFHPSNLMNQIEMFGLMCKTHFLTKLKSGKNPSQLQAEKVLDSYDQPFVVTRPSIFVSYIPNPRVHHHFPYFPYKNIATLRAYPRFSDASNDPKYLWFIHGRRYIYICNVHIPFYPHEFLSYIPWRC